MRVDEDGEKAFREDNAFTSEAGRRPWLTPVLVILDTDDTRIGTNSNDDGDGLS